MPNPELEPGARVEATTLTRRRLLKYGLAAGFTALLNGVWDPLKVEASRPSETTPHELLSQLGYKWVWGDTHAHSSISDNYLTPPELITELGTQRQDFFFLTDHGEQISPDEHRRGLALTHKLQSQGKLVGLGEEWTGTPDYLDPNGKKTSDPAYIKGPGHMLVYGSDDEVVGQQEKNGGKPTVLSTFSGLLNWIPKASTPPLVAFAHPSLYRVEETFDQNGDGRGFDPAPADPNVVDAVFGCEVCSHTFRAGGTETYRGLGNGTDLRSSNEACYRQLLRGGWRIAPMMSTDQHLPGYDGAGPYTAVAVRERSIEGVLDGFYERLTCATEEPGVSIALTGIRRDSPILMGQTLEVEREAMDAFAKVSIQDRHGRTIKPKECGIVLVCRNPVNDVDYTDMYRKWRQRDDQIPVTSTFKIPFWRDHMHHYADDKELVAFYAKATLANGHQLISAPVFCGYN